MIVEVFNGNWSIKDVNAQKNKIFIFGDNDLRLGKGGQAIIRDLKNTIGIRTKKEPNNNYNSFYSDVNYDLNISNIKEDIINIINKSKEGYILVFSNGGYGTGLARLKIKAPLTFKFLNDQLFENFGYDNLNGSLSY